MTIRKGEEWGSDVVPPPDLVEVTSDAELAARVGDSSIRLLVRGGDLHRTIGSPRGRPARVRLLPIDVVRVVGDGIDTVAVAHVVVRRAGRLGWLRGPIVAVMNVDHIGPLDVAPRAHPNDGRFDVVTVATAMSVRDRVRARRRLPTGTHVAHPDITVRQAKSVGFEFDRHLGVWVDGVPLGRARTVSMTIEPDAAIVYA